nr:MAG TPA: hypothetical protein [Caudoviricetes sp.]
MLNNGCGVSFSRLVFSTPAGDVRTGRLRVRFRSPDLFYVGCINVEK